MSGSRRVTYAELISRVRDLAAHLCRVLPDDGSPVAVVGHKEPEMVVGFLGAALAGHPYVPIDSGTHGGPIPLPARGAARDVGEEERDGAGGKIGHDPFQTLGWS